MPPLDGLLFNLPQFDPLPLLRAYNLVTLVLPFISAWLIGGALWSLWASFRRP